MSKICNVCNTTEVRSGKPRCLACDRAWNARRARKLRDRKKVADLAMNTELLKKGWQRCAVCHDKKKVCEFRTTQPHRKGKLNKICDTCLTRIYTNPCRQEADTRFSPRYWRRKAYAANTNARNRIAKKQHIKTSSTSLEMLPWICKPQDLAKLYEAQGHACYYCRVQLIPSDIHVDHKRSFKKGGEHAVTNTVLACGDCNRLKWTRNEEEFTAFIVMYAKRILARVADAGDKEPPAVTQS